jgi:hypothetical protein
MVYTAPADTEYKIFLPPRDFVGYGLDKPKGDVWPNGAKIAVSFVLNCESLFSALLYLLSPSFEIGKKGSVEDVELITRRRRRSRTYNLER